MISEEERKGSRFMSHEGADRSEHGETRKPVMDVEEIRALLPHRFPMLLVDRILELEPGKRAVGLKNVTINEPFFTGHFPGQAIMPGVLILEAMAQVAGLMMLVLPEQQGKLAYLAGADNFRVRRPVVPGDTLIIEANLVKSRGTMGKVRLSAQVEGVPTADCEMLFALMDPRTSDKANQRLSGENGRE